jgi:lactoylglutathione lyase
MIPDDSQPAEPRMKIEHIAVWTRGIERLRAFYETYFDARAGKKYVNARNRFESSRHTGDGYHASVVFDPDGNRIEITV